MDMSLFEKAKAKLLEQGMDSKLLDRTAPYDSFSLIGKDLAVRQFFIQDGQVLLDSKVSKSIAKNDSSKEITSDKVAGVVIGATAVASAISVATGLYHAFAFEASYKAGSMGMAAKAAAERAQVLFPSIQAGATAFAVVVGAVGLYVVAGKAKNAISAEISERFPDLMRIESNLSLRDAVLDIGRSDEDKFSGNEGLRILEQFSSNQYKNIVVTNNSGKPYELTPSKLAEFIDSRVNGAKEQSLEAQVHVNKGMQMS